MDLSPTIDFATQLDYYAVRDTLLGLNYVKQDIRLALELASACQHAEARWFTEIFAGKVVKTREDARNVFLEQGNDARALCFRALLSAPLDGPRLRRSADLGFAFAQAGIALRGTLLMRNSHGLCDRRCKESGMVFIS